MKTLICVSCMLSLSLVLVAPVDTTGCCMAPRNFFGKISQNAQQGILFHHDGREELILQIDYRLTPGVVDPAQEPDGTGDRQTKEEGVAPVQSEASDVEANEKEQAETEQELAALPDRFAWVVTVPNEPDAYSVADAGIFNDVGDWAEHVLAPPRPSGGGCACADSSAPPNASAGVVLGERAVVGPYDIQPVRGVGSNALESLNAWLDENGFPTEDPQHMTYFVENNFTFLCIRVSPPDGKTTVSAGGELDPLHLSFESERPYYPLMFSSRQGVFELRLLTLTSVPLDFKRSRLHRLGWSHSSLKKNVPVTTQEFPEVLRESYARNMLENAPAKWHLNFIESYRVNSRNELAELAADIFLITHPEAEVHQASMVDAEVVWLLLIACCIPGLRKCFSAAGRPRQISF